MSGLLFVTAPEADYKTINHLLLCIRSWSNGDGQEIDFFGLVTAKSHSLTEAGNIATSPPLRSLEENVWLGASIEDVENYCSKLEPSNEGDHAGAGLFVLLDSEGVKSKTCVLASLPGEYYDTPSTTTFQGRYDKIRVPWDEIYLVWCNLDIANMNFEEFTVQDGDDQRDEDGWFTYESISEDSPLEEDELKRKNAEIERFRAQNYI